jgi:drug/metabolite transporter (DMT)-like permease
MKHYIHLHLLVLLLAATALLGEVISIPSAGVVVWRTLFAAIGAALWVNLVWRKALWPGGRTVGALFGVGVVVGLHWMLFFQSLKVSNISICLAGLATIPLFTAFTEPFFERRRLRVFEILVGLVIMAGILVVAGSIDLTNRAGLAYALGSAALAAVFPVMNRKIVLSGGDPLTMVAWEMAGALGVSFGASVALGEAGTLLAWRGLDWFWVIVLALACTVFAHGFQIRLLKYLGAYTVNLAISFEPLYGILAAAWAFGEYKQLTPMFYVGLSAILLANVLHPLGVRLSRRASERM